ncbi:MAG: hypothetical protein LBO69_08060 [Ignavibacteria bacterium]|nr:hypothetical protein [Ignavibacteria bacterium]
MKRITILILCLISVAILYAGTCTLDYFKATSNGEAVNIEWKTTLENGVQRFEVERMTTNGYTVINTQKALNKPGTYKYTDSDIFTKETQLQSVTTATYRLKICYSPATPEQPAYSEPITVTRNMSSIKRTLGMLKEMFK